MDDDPFDLWDELEQDDENTPIPVSDADVGASHWLPVAERFRLGDEGVHRADGGISAFPEGLSGQQVLGSLPFGEPERRKYDWLRSKGYTATPYDYRDADGLLRLIVTHFRHPTEAKIVMPLVCCGYNAKGRPIYWWQGIRGSLPLFGLDQLAARPNAPVLVVEGEKAAAAGAKLFPDYVVVCWPHGAGAALRVDVSALVGREVVGLPDNDEAGRRGMARLLAKATVAEAGK